jgi:hypothetical protein
VLALKGGKCGKKLIFDLKTMEKPRLSVAKEYFSSDDGHLADTKKETVGVVSLNGGLELGLGH